MTDLAFLFSEQVKRLNAKYPAIMIPNGANGGYSRRQLKTMECRQELLTQGVQMRIEKASLEDKNRVAICNRSNEDRVKKVGALR